MEHPRVSLNFNSIDGHGITVFIGSVEIIADGPRPEEVPEYVEKYSEHVAALSSGKQSLAEFMSDYSVVSRIRPIRVRGF